MYHTNECYGISVAFVANYRGFQLAFPSLPYGRMCEWKTRCIQPSIPQRKNIIDLYVYVSILYTIYIYICVYTHRYMEIVCMQKYWRQLCNLCMHHYTTTCTFSSRDLGWAIYIISSSTLLVCKQSSQTHWHISVTYIFWNQVKISINEKCWQC